MYKVGDKIVYIDTFTFFGTIFKIEGSALWCNWEDDGKQAFIDHTKYTVVPFSVYDSPLYKTLNEIVATKD